jgi:hypothetical protein
MKLLFKDSGAAKPKISDTNFAEHYPAVHQNMSWLSLQTFVRQATEEHVLKYIGEDLYNPIATKFNDSTALTPTEASFLSKMQDAIAYYTIYLATPFINVTIGDMGAQQSSSSEGTSNPASQWAYKNLVWKVCLKADSLMDSLLSWMEKRVKAEDPYFGDWKASLEYKAGTSALFRRIEDLEQFINIHNSRRTFLALLPYLDKVYQKHIIPVIGQELFNQITDQIQASNLTAENLKLLPILQRVVAEWVVVLAIPHLAVVMEASGFKIVSESDGMSHRSNLQNQQHMEAINALKYQAESDGKTFKAELFSFVYSNQADYPLFTASNVFITETTDELVRTPCNDIGGIML